MLELDYDQFRMELSFCSMNGNRKQAVQIELTPLVDLIWFIPIK